MAAVSEPPKDTKPNVMGTLGVGGMLAIVLQWGYPIAWPRAPAMPPEVAAAITTLVTYGAHGIQAAMLNWRKARWPSESPPSPPAS